MRRCRGCGRRIWVAWLLGPSFVPRGYWHDRCRSVWRVKVLPHLSDEDFVRRGGR